jgi:hypothetical protein
MEGRQMHGRSSRICREGIEDAGRYQCVGLGEVDAMCGFGMVPVWDGCMKREG